MLPRLVLGLWIVGQAPGGSGGMGAGFGSPPAIYSIEGYLDSAPEGVQVLEGVQIGKGDRRRTWLITSYWRLGGGNRSELLRDTGHGSPAFMIAGRSADVEALLGGPEGSRVRGKFQHRRGALRSLVIAPHELTVSPPP